MTDRDIFDLELSPGERPPSGFGDRALVGIAGLALLAGLGIAVVNAVPHDQTAQASPTPSVAPTQTPRPIPTPEPGRVATLVPPDVEVVQPSSPPSFSGWIRTLADIVLVASPDMTAAKTGVLAKGTAANADQEGEPADGPGWLHVQDPEGWIESVQNGKQLVRRYEWPQYRSSGWVNNLFAGAEGILAMANPVSDPGQYQPSTPLVTSDGATWLSTSSSAFGNREVSGLAWGPAGWLAVTYVSDSNRTNRIWIWQSRNGRTSWAIRSGRRCTGTRRGGPGGCCARRASTTSTNAGIWSTPTRSTA